jgi:tetratricopeptide (TPR) repeat protein
VIEVDEADIESIVEKPWTPPARPGKKPPSRKVPGWPEVQPAPAIEFRAVYRDPFLNFRLLFPEEWRFEATDRPERFEGRGPAGEKLELSIERAAGDLKSFAAGRVQAEKDEDLKIGGLPAKRLEAGERVWILVDGGERKFVLSGPKGETEERILRSIRVFAEHAGTPENRKRYDELYRTAVNEMNASNFPAAIRELERLREVVPNYPEAHSLLFRACTYVPSEHKRGMEAMKKAAALDPDNFEYRFYLAQILVTLRKFGEAEKEAVKAVELQPWSEPGWTQVGIATLLQQNYKKAKEALRRALEINPKSVPATYNLGACFESEGKVEDARTAYEQVLKFDPEHAQAKAGLSRLK